MCAVTDDPDFVAFKIGLDHAWAWFDLHAGQRMQFVNFWLVASAFLASALVSALSRDRFALGVALSLTGFVATACFYRLERRTRALVRIGEDAMRHAQRVLARRTGIKELELVSAADGHSRVLGGYGQIIRLLHGTAAVAFAGAALWSMGKWTS